MKSHSVEILPYDARCRYWAKIVRAGMPLPSPSLVSGANDIPSAYLQKGEDELLPGDVLFEGEANHHRSNRGWSYWVTYVTEAGDLVKIGHQDFGDIKVLFKQQGMEPDYLKGAGDVAAMVRIAHGLRMGMSTAVPQSATTG